MIRCSCCLLTFSCFCYSCFLYSYYFMFFLIHGGRVIGENIPSAIRISWEHTTRKPTWGNHNLSMCCFLESLSTKRLRNIFIVESHNYNVMGVILLLCLFSCNIQKFLTLLSIPWKIWFCVSLFFCISDTFMLYY